MEEREMVSTLIHCREERPPVWLVALEMQRQPTVRGKTTTIGVAMLDFVTELQSEPHFPSNPGKWLERLWWKALNFELFAGDANPALWVQDLRDVMFDHPETLPVVEQFIAEAVADQRTRSNARVCVLVASLNVEVAQVKKRLRAS